MLKLVLTLRWFRTYILTLTLTRGREQRQSHPKGQGSGLQATIQSRKILNFIGMNDLHISVHVRLRQGTVSGWTSYPGISFVVVRFVSFVVDRV